MRVFGKRVDQLRVDDIAQLIDLPVYESKVLDFKKQLPGPSDGDKAEFVKDVTAMANTAGGVIVFGIDERRADESKAGHATQVVGISSDPVQAAERLGQILHAGSSPPVTPYTTFAHVTLPTGEVVLLLGIHQSPSRPHRQQLGRNRFLRRNDSGAYEPDVTELRELFLEADAWTEQAESLITERLQYLQMHVMPDVEHPFVAVHILPLGQMRRRIALGHVVDAARGAFQPLYPSGGNTRYNGDGFAMSNYGPPTERGFKSHSQLFRFGGLEGVSGELLRKEWQHVDGQRRSIRHVLGVKTTGEVRHFIQRGIADLGRYAETYPPFLISLALVNVRGFAVIRPMGEIPHEVIERNEIRVSAFIADSEPKAVDSEVRYLTDVMWHAGNFAPTYFPSEA